MNQPSKVVEDDATGTLSPAMLTAAVEASGARRRFDRMMVDQIPGVFAITKARDGLGTSYRGQLLLPNNAPRYEVTVDAREHGTTRVREALVTGALAECGELRIDPPASPGEPGRIHGWFLDPYDPAFDAGALNSVADDERLDAMMPSHPLSKVRGVLRSIVAGAVIDRTQEFECHAADATLDGPSQPRRGRLSSSAIDVLEAHFTSARRNVEAATTTEARSRGGGLLSIDGLTVGVAVSAAACVGLALAGKADAAVIAGAIAVLLAGLVLRRAEEGSWRRYAGTVLSLMSTLGLLRYVARLLSPDE